MVPERKNLKNLIILSVLIVISIIIITVSFKQSDVFTKARMATLDFFKPVQEKTYQFFQPVTTFFVDIKYYFNLKNRINELEEQNSSLIKNYSENVNLKIENDALRRLLGVSVRDRYNTLPAKVIGYYDSKWQSEILINEGRSSGVVEGMAVVTDEGLVGTVILASNSTSEVRLLTDPQSSIGARLLSSRKLGVAEGSLDKNIYLNYITADEEVFKGDVLMTSEFGEFMPPEILIGRIKKIGSGTDTPYKKIEVEPFVDFRKLEYVLVIKG
ncbi:MAG: rod shape-determining protein MreC [Actinobacteria bacterium]|nr:rod shape-determining protein MreC [Actinomycetota bacterium]